ncbi:SGNH/GDSL hydrolase family protein [Butyrivibrio sp. AC2005]|uniref:SGNH/GDSL hydrolase family protein n=1 Tax=Butyrivibrio sp. AC2005 TaxID=1280672 RepID=UPI00040074B2|nr:SGNH/GDSL hydrolase family protein [Butyrivibrio sp. AC2005]
MMKNFVISKFKDKFAILLSFILCACLLTASDANFAISAKASKESSVKNYIENCIDENVKVLFIGDSRTVDMFYADKSEIKGKVYNNITVYAKDGATFGYMKNTLKKVNVKNYDVIVSWMGANDHGNFDKYSSYYKKLNKKTHGHLVLCTIGYSDNSKLGDLGDCLYYNDGIMQNFNKGLNKWAKKNHVETINLYSYTKKHVTARSNNGVHYVPSPTVDLWNYTVKQIIKKVGEFGFTTEEEPDGTGVPKVPEEKVIQ